MNSKQIARKVDALMLVLDDCDTHETLTALFTLVKITREVTDVATEDFDRILQKCVDHIVGVI